jgi:hypothetical protein
VVGVVTNSQWVAFAIASGFGLVLAAIGLIFTWRRVVRVRRSGVSPLQRTATVCLAAPRADAVDFVVAAIRSSRGSVVSKDPEKGQVLAKYGMSLRTWGQFLQVDLWDTDLGEQQCVCTCWPSRESVITEWGAGDITIARFLDRLTEVAPSGTVVGKVTAGRTLDS